jgi:N-acyl-phosphatidylethanolamine-hydrolysing phospholipase D
MKPNLFKLFKRYHNPPGGSKRSRNLFKWLGFMIRRMRDKPPAVPNLFVIPEQKALSQYQALLHENTITWIGHNTFIIKINGKTILTDPFLFERASPFASIGPKRFTPPGISIQNLPPIDIILLSHNHYDHMDLPTLNNLANKSQIHVVIPLGLGKYFKKMGYQHIQELDWNESVNIHNITIHALPVYHYSKRNLFTSNTSLWVGFSVRWQDKRLYFSGDTGYGSLFLDIGRDYGPFDYALLSIGAYEPNELMYAVHQSPEIAIRTAQELRATTVIPMHWGTITLADEPAFDPPVRFRKAAFEAGYTEERTWIMNIGETRSL